MQISFQPIKPEDVEKIFQFQKELIERYEDLSSIDCEKVFAWCKKKIQITMQDYRRIMVEKELAGYFALHKEDSGEWELDEERSTWADIPADVIARKLIEGFGLDAILKGVDAD